MMVIQVSSHISLIDDADFSVISKYKWHISHNGYAIRRERIGDGRKKVIYMHKSIFGESNSLDIDHIDGNKLNNCRSNLRIATRTLNNANSKPRIGCSSRFKGVSWVKGYKRWWSYINIHGKRKCLGYYTDEIEAAKAYNLAAKATFGEFSRINQI